MTVIGMFSDKGSPGVTTLALSLASVWPRPVTLVEADPAGGDLARRLTDASGRPALASEPNVMTLAAAARRDVDAIPSLLWTHAQPLPSGDAGATVVPGLETPEQGAAMTDLWAPLGAVLRAADLDVLVDLGRISKAGVGPVVVDRCDVLVGVARAEAAAMIRLRDRLRNLLNTELTPDDMAAVRRVLVVLVAEDRRAGEAAAAMERVLVDSLVTAQVAGTIAIDPGAVARLHRSPSDPRLSRSLLLRSATALAARIGGEAVDTNPVPRRRLLARAR
jgi:hypothetical protein